MDAFVIQELLMRDMKSADTLPAARAQLARAWECLEERKRILRMRPKPKDIDVSTKKPRTRTPPAPNFTE